jgi:hypothetical protein
VSFGTRRRDVETDPIVANHHLHLVALLFDLDPDVLRLGVLERVHHRLTGVVVQQERDRSRHIDLGDVGVEPHLRLARHLRKESLDRLSQPSAPERRSVQVTDQRADPIGRLVLRLLDLGGRLLSVVDPPSIEVLTCHVHLDRESEQQLSQIVVQERSDL